MHFRRLFHAFRTLPLLAILALGALGCSGKSDTDADEDDTGGSSTGGNSGTGGTGGMGGSSGTGGSPIDCTLGGIVDPTALIDDIEDGDSLIATVGDRNGSWWITSDETAGTITPPHDQAPPPERILGMRCESEFGMRMTGQGFTTWGAVISIGFKYTTAEDPIDASAFSGVMFWARVGETHNSAIRFQFQDSNTHPNGGVCDPTPGAADECYDGWGTDIAPIDETWRLYRIPFARIAQRGFGYQGDAMDTTAIYNMGWGVTQDTVFDLWIDDVWFYE